MENRGLAPPDPRRHLAGRDEVRGLAPPDPRGAWAAAASRAGGARAAAGLAVVAAAVLAGCDSTQDKNARAELRAKRELAARELPSVRRADPRVRVERATLVRGAQAGTGAIVVELRNRADEPLTDVPIAVGVRGRDGRRRVVNARRHLDWFQTHVPAIAPGEKTTWVFKGARGIAAGDRAFAKVGAAARPALSRASALPRIEAAVEPGAAEAVPEQKAQSGAKRRRSGERAAARRSATARVTVENPSDVPQYDLQVYALAERGGRPVAAGKATVEHLGTGQRKTVAVPLAGRRGSAPLRASAIPTIFE